MPRKAPRAPRKPRTVKPPLKPTDQNADETGIMLTLLTGQMQRLNSFILLFNELQPKDVQSNSDVHETVEALLSESLEMVNLTMSISVLLRIWMSTYHPWLRTSTDAEEMAMLLAGMDLTLDEVKYHFE